MPKYSKSLTAHHTERIRALIVRNPKLTIAEIQDALKKSPENYNFDKDYVHRLMRKIHGDRAYRLNYYTVNEWLAKYEDEIQELKKKLWGVIQSPAAKPGEKVLAIRELRASSSDLFDKLFDSGVFERNLGRLKVEPVRLSAEQMELINKAIAYDKERAEKYRAGADSSEPDDPAAVSG